MPRTLRVLLAALLLLVAVVGLLGVLPQLTQSAALPTTPGHTSAHVSAYGPGVVGLVLVGVILVALAVHVARVARRPASAATWILAAVLAAAALATPFLIAALQRPTF